MATEELPNRALLGQVLRRGRVDAGLSLDELADATGIPADTLHAYERGRTVPLPTSLRRLATALSLPNDIARLRHPYARDRRPPRGAASPTAGPAARMLTEAYLVREYLERGRSAADIAAEVGCSPGRVAARRQELGLPPRRAWHGRRDYLTHAEAAQLLGVNRATITSLAKDGRLPRGGTARRPLYRRSDVEAMRAERAERDQYLTRAEAATRIGIKPAALSYLADQGRIPSTRIGHHRYYRASDVDTAARQRKAHDHAAPRRPPSRRTSAEVRPTTP